MIYTISLNPAIDYTLKLDKNISNDINRTEDASYSIGGKSINCNIAISNYGGKAKSLIMLGKDNIEQALKLLNGINFDYTEVDGSTRTNVKILALDKEVFINADTLSVKKADVDTLISKINEIKDADAFIVSGSLPKTMKTEWYLEILDAIKKMGKKLVIDTAGENLIEAAKVKPFLVKPNLDELRITFGNVTREQGAQMLLDLGVENVIVSDGKNDISLHGRVEHTVKPKEINIVSSNGAGDTTLSVFTKLVTDGCDMKYALEYASLAGSATAAKVGISTKEELRSYGWIK